MANVLIVEDEPAVRRTLERVLAAAGHATAVADDVPDALARLEVDAFDVVVTDVLLPGESGITLLRHLQEIAPDTQVIVITGEPTVESAVEAVRARAYEYLAKPISSAQLQRVVAKAARVKELEDDRRRLQAANRQYQENLETLVAERTRALRESEARLRQSEQQLHALAARLIQVREAERAHMAREIHDELGQLLTGLKMDLHWLARQCQNAAAPAPHAALAVRLRDALSLADTTIKCVQRLAAELRPSALDKLGLCAALRQELRQFGERFDLACRLDLPEDEPPLPPDLAMTLFRITQECLTNIVRHAQATRVDIRLADDAGGWVLLVADNGRGISDAELADPKSLGLMGIKERALLCHGQVEFERPPAGGTRVTVRIPNPPDGQPTPTP